MKKSYDQRNETAARYAIDVLNRALKSDPEAVAALLKTRAHCNEVLANDPTVQVAAKSEGFTVGVLGLINGLFGVRENDCGYIAARYDVVCPSNPTHIDDNYDGPKVNVKDKCPSCAAQLELGALKGFELTAEAHCSKCGQSGEDLGGEYPCSECGRATLHDPEPQ